MPGSKPTIDRPDREVALGMVLDRTERYMRDVGYRGYDPYDGLESPLFRLPFLRSTKVARWGFQQLYKRIPFQTRPLFGIPRGYNPVTLALAIEGLIFRDRTHPAGTGGRRAEVARLVSELETMQTPGFSGSCWGYDFDWEARYASFSAGYPTVVATGFVTHALFLAWKEYGIETARDLCLAAVPFVRKDLNRTVEGDAFCWSYSPADNQIVLNASMIGARLLAEAVNLGADSSILEDAVSTIRYVLSRQTGAGSWPYSIGDKRPWADNFHTCYILDCLHEYQALTGNRSFREAMEKGLEYYCDCFFTDEGIPRYYDRKTYPIDATGCGQSLLTLVRFGKIEQAQRTAAWILDHMTLPTGAFKYRIHRSFENRLPYMRWSDCWMFAGLASLEYQLARSGAGDTPESDGSGPPVAGLF